MKIFIYVVCVLLILGFAYLWVEGKEVRSLGAEVDIEASIEEVWNVLVDFDAWHEWNPIVTQSRGTALAGTTLNITMIGSESGVDGPSYQPIILHIDRPNYLHWRAVMFHESVLRNEKIIELVRTADGTRLMHRELFKGFVVPIFFSKFEKNVPNMIRDMNAALKIRVENSSTGTEKNNSTL